MPKTTKKFIDKKKAVTFNLVHRSQRDPLTADETAPQRVLVPVNASVPPRKEKDPVSVPYSGCVPPLYHNTVGSVAFQNDYQGWIMPMMSTPMPSMNLMDGYNLMQQGWMLPNMAAPLASTMNAMQACNMPQGGYVSKEYQSHSGRSTHSFPKVHSTTYITEQYQFPHDRSEQVDSGTRLGIRESNTNRTVSSRTFHFPRLESPSSESHLNSRNSCYHHQENSPKDHADSRDSSNHNNNRRDFLNSRDFNYNSQDGSDNDISNSHIDSRNSNYDHNQRYISKPHTDPGNPNSYHKNIYSKDSDYHSKNISSSDFNYHNENISSRDSNYHNENISTRVSNYHNESSSSSNHSRNSNYCHKNIPDTHFDSRYSKQHNKISESYFESRDSYNDSRDSYYDSRDSYNDPSYSKYDENISKTHSESRNSNYYFSKTHLDSRDSQKNFNKNVPEISLSSELLLYDKYRDSSYHQENMSRKHLDFADSCSSGVEKPDAQNKYLPSKKQPAIHQDSTQEEMPVEYREANNENEKNNLPLTNEPPPIKTYTRSESVRLAVVHENHPNCRFDHRDLISLQELITEKLEKSPDPLPRLNVGDLFFGKLLVSCNCNLAAQWLKDNVHGALLKNGVKVAIRKVKEKKKSSGASRRRYTFWLQQGLTKTEANARSRRQLAEFPEYLELIAARKTEPPINYVIKSTEASLSNTATLQFETTKNYKKPKMGSARRRRYQFWIRQGLTETEAATKSLHPLSDFPEYLKLASKNEEKQAGKRPSSSQGDLEEQSKISRKTNRTSGETGGFIKIGIMDRRRPITTELAVLIEKAINRCVAHTEDDAPHFLGSTIQDGMLILICEDNSTRNWLEKHISDIKCWKKADLRLVDNTELSKRALVVTHIRNPITDEKSILKLLHKYNENVGCNRWRVANVTPKADGQTYCFSLDSQQLSKLLQQNCTLFFGLKPVKFIVKRSAKGPFGSEGSALAFNDLSAVTSIATGVKGQEQWHGALQSAPSNSSERVGMGCFSETQTHLTLNSRSITWSNCHLADANRERLGSPSQGNRQELSELGESHRSERGSTTRDHFNS